MMTFLSLLLLFFGLGATADTMSQRDWRLAAVRFVACAALIGVGLWLWVAS